MTNFKTLITTEIKYSFSMWHARIMIILCGFSVGIGALSSNHIFSGAGTILFYTIFMSLQMSIAFETGATDRTRAKYLYFTANQVYLSKIIVNTLWMFAMLVTVGIIITIIAAVQNNPLVDLSKNIPDLILSILGMLSIYVVILIVTEISMSFTTNFARKKIFGMLALVAMVTPLMVAPWVVLYSEGFRTFLGNGKIWYWFIPMFNILLLSIPGVAYNYLIIIPIIYIFIFVLFIGKKASRRMKLGALT